MPIGHPFNGIIYYGVETSYGSGIGSIDSERRISDAVENVRLDTGDINMVLQTISSPNFAKFEKANEDYTLHVEWIYQPNTSGSLASYCINRTSCDLENLAFELGVNVGCGDASYYNIKGAKCKTFNMSASRGDAYKCTADFSVSDVAVTSTATGADPGAIGTDYAMFNTAGSITWAGVTGAYVTDSFDLTVENNLEDYYDVGSSSKKAAIPGAKEITGSCDISLDGGGGTHFSEVVAGTDITSVAFDTGLASGDAGIITLTDGRFENTSVNQDTSGGMLNSVPFKFQDITLTTS